MNKKENKISIKSIIILMILLALIGIVAFNKTFAVDYNVLDNLIAWGNVGDRLEIGWKTGSAQLAANDEWNLSNLYCIEHSNSTVRKSWYGVAHRITIDGNRATSSNGLYTDSVSNGVLAYILGGGNYSYGYGVNSSSTTVRQKELWHYWSTWLNDSGEKLGISGWRDAANEAVGSQVSLETEAKTYASNYCIAQISSNVGNLIEVDNQIAGPFNISYTGVISYAEVKDVNGSPILERISYIQNNQVIPYSDILPGQDFYIVNDSGRTLKDLTINVSNTTERIKVDILFLNNTYSQKLIAVKPERIPEITTNSVKIEMRIPQIKIPNRNPAPDTFNITINKKPVTGNTLLAGAQFKIKVLNRNGKAIGWLQEFSDNEYEYGVSYKNATTWSTTKTSKDKDNFVYADTKGIIEIEDLSTEYEYEIYETKQADGYVALQSQIIKLASGEISPSGMNVRINNDKIEDIEYIKAQNKSNEKNNFAAIDNSIYCGTTSYDEHGSSANVVVTNRNITGGGRRRRRRKRKHNTIFIY